MNIKMNFVLIFLSVESSIFEPNEMNILNANSKGQKSIEATFVVPICRIKPILFNI